MGTIDLSNYYECDPQIGLKDSSGRYSTNHVKYSALLKPLAWFDAVQSMIGSGAFKIKDAMLKEFDSAAPLDQYLGTDEDLKENRDLIISFCDGVDNNPYLSSIGRFLTKKMIVDWLKNRKKVLKYYDDNKDFIEAKGNFKAPVIITGAPRTGTTLLQRIMSEDPNSRSPYTYEMEAALPPMTADADPMADPRIKSSGAAMSAITKLAPGFLEKFAESHLWSATEMEESFIYMMIHNGLHLMHQPLAGFDYTDKIFNNMEGKRCTFKYERIFFNMLDAYRPAKSHWTLKSPSYSIYYPLLMEEYSDAKVVLTHRNPMMAQPSLCRLMESWCIAFDKNGSFDKKRFGQTQAAYEKQCLMGPMEHRKEHPEQEDRVFDCVYEELFKDPIAMVRKIYEKFDMEYTQEFEDRMRTYLQNNKQGKYGRHVYSLEEYGFEAQKIYNEYKPYMERYNYGIPEKFERKTSFDFGV
jgi:hypothetical protein